MLRFKRSYSVLAKCTGDSCDSAPAICGLGSVVYNVSSSIFILNLCTDMLKLFLQGRYQSILDEICYSILIEEKL